MNDQYKFVELSRLESGFLGKALDLIDENSLINHFVPNETLKISRKTSDGFITVISYVEGQKVGIVYNDFRSFGSSAGIENSHRVCEFIDYCNDNNLTLIYLCNSIGVRVQDGRNVFKNSFSIIPKIKNFCKNNLYITVSLGQTLGLGAVLYSLAHYRFAIKDQCKFNLTGPEVFKMFFGNKISFEEVCNEKELFENSLLVQEIHIDHHSIFTKIKKILNQNQEKIVPTTHNNLVDQLIDIERKSVNLFNQFGKSIEIRIINTSKGRVGLIINPYKRPNLLSVEDLEKFICGLEFFKRLKLPIYTLVDTAGGDPRIEENNKNIARKIYDLSCAIIDYPYRKQGIIIGRCYGGSSVLSMPEFFGGEPSLLVQGAHIGIMGSQIIKKLLSNTPVLYKIWETNNEKEDDEYNDMINAGIIKKIIPENSLIENIINELP